MPHRFPFHWHKFQRPAPPSRRWRALIPLGLLAMAAGGALMAWSGRESGGAEVFLIPALPPPQSRGLQALLNSRDRPSPPLTVPPVVLPQPLPPHLAWPDLPLRRTQPSFTDLQSDHWAWPLLADLAQRELVAGFPDGSFRPADPVSRAEFATQVARLFDFSLAPSSEPGVALYEDVTTSHWAHDSVQKSVQMGFLSGYPGSKFLPDQTVSRIQVIVALANGLRLTSSSGEASMLAPYGDRAQVPSWATQQLVAAIEAGLVINYPEPEALTPNQTASRAEVAAMLHRALVYMGKLQDVPFPHVVGQ